MSVGVAFVAYWAVVALGIMAVDMLGTTDPSNHGQKVRANRKIK